MSWDGAGSAKRLGSPGRIRVVVALCLLSLTGWGGHSAVASAQLRVDEATIPQVEAAFREGTLTCHQLVKSYLDRIAALDQTGPAVNSFLELNPDALTIADQLDRDFRQNGPVGPLHCVPMVLKDNYDTADRNHTTAASLTMLGFVASSDAFQVAKLRAAGAVFLGKVNMDEWAVGVSGYSSRGGQTRNPYRTDHGPGGSSGGTGVAVSANFALAGVGTDTIGSIQLPAAFDGIVGIRPTSGLTGRSGIIPGSLFSDASGPMTRTVTDAAIILGVMTGIDPNDPATEASAGKSFAKYTQFLHRDGLRNAHIGVLRTLFGMPLSGDNGEIDATFNHAVADMRERGALITDPVSIDGSEADITTLMTVNLYWAKPSLDSYFATFGAGAPVHSLAEVIAASEQPEISNKVRPATLQALIEAQKLGDLSDPAYLSALAIIKSLRASLLQFMEQNGFDALVFPATTCVAPPLPGVIDPAYQCGSVAQPLAPGEIHGVMPVVLSPISGFPVIVVPAGFSSDGLPIEISFFGEPFSEPTLIKLAFAFEQATKARRPPQFVAPTGVAAATAANAPPTASAPLSQPYGWLLDDFERSGGK